MSPQARGFTLVELLVVISIIALLVSLLLPALSGARGSAKAITCAQRVRQISLAIEAYATDNDGEVLVYYAPGRVFNNANPDWVGRVAPYLDMDVPEGTGNPIERGGANEAIYCPLDTRERRGSYGVPSTVVSAFDNGPDDLNGNGSPFDVGIDDDFRRVDYYNVPKASRIVFATEVHIARNTRGNTYNNATRYMLALAPPFAGALDVDWLDDSYWHPNFTQHYLYFDGHVDAGQLPPHPLGTGGTFMDFFLRSGDVILNSQANQNAFRYALGL